MELVHPVLVEVADASKVLSRKVALLVMEGLLEVVEVDWLEQLELPHVVQSTVGQVP